MNFTSDFSRQSLLLDAASEVQRITKALDAAVHGLMRRQGAVVGISGGVDSSVVLALCVGCFGSRRVTAVTMPEKESDPESEIFARSLADCFGVGVEREDITKSLEGFGCYTKRDEAIRRVVPEYDPAAGYKARISLPPVLQEAKTLNVFSVEVVRPDGTVLTEPLPALEFRQIMAASNFKQRARMSVLNYHAELNHRAVIGTPNKNEHDLGFFVKHGDGGVDVNPIAHLFKTQVYQLAEYLGVPAEIRRRTPTTDTYSAQTTQEEFFFRLPFETMDLIWHGMERGVPTPEIACVMGLSESQVSRVIDDILQKQHATQYLRLPPVSLSPGAAEDSYPKVLASGASR